MVTFGSDACFLIDNGSKGCSYIFWQCSSDADREVVFALGIDNLHLLAISLDVTTVADLTTHLAIEWSLGKHDLIEGLVLLLYLTVTENFGLALEEVIAHELWSACLDLNPVAILHGSCITGTFLLSLHVLVELLFVDGESVLAADELCEVERETKSVEESECLVTVDHCASLGLGIVHDGVDTLDAVFESTEERIFLFLDYLDDELLLSDELWVSIAHCLNEHRDEFIEERFLLTEIGVGIANGTTENATDHVASLSVAWQLTIGNCEGDGADMVGKYAHCHISLLVFTISLAR